MSSSSPHRKILIIEDKPSLYNVLFTLAGSLGIDGKAAFTGEQALKLLQGGEFDAVLLDLRCTDVRPEEVVPAIHSLQPKLVGRVLVITGEVVDSKTLDLIEKHFLRRIRASDRVEDMAASLRELFCQAPPLKPAA